MELSESQDFDASVKLKNSSKEAFLTSENFVFAFLFREIKPVVW